MHFSAALTPVTTTVLLGPGAEDNPLAAWAHDTLVRRRGAGSSAAARRRRSELGALRAAVVLVARDRRLSATLRFDHGQVTVHDGVLGIPDVTLCADHDALVALAALPLSRRLRVPWTRGWHPHLARLLSGELKAYGLLAHPRTLLRVLRLFAPDESVAA